MAIKQRGRHFGVAERLRPFAEAQGRDPECAGALLELAQQEKLQRASARSSAWARPVAARRAKSAHADAAEPLYTSLEDRQRREVVQFLKTDIETRCG
jgi:hypothetical protein